MMEIFSDSRNVYALAFGLFWVLMYVFARKPVLQWLDSEIGKISAELNMARDLRREAEVALEDCKVKQAKADEDARTILRMASEQAESMRRQAEEDLASFLSRQKNLATERIRQEQERAVNSIRSEAVKLGMDIARKTLEEKLSSAADAGRFLERTMEEIPSFKAVNGNRN